MGGRTGHGACFLLETQQSKMGCQAAIGYIVEEHKTSLQLC